MTVDRRAFLKLLSCTLIPIRGVEPRPRFTSPEDSYSLAMMLVGQPQTQLMEIPNPFGQTATLEFMADTTFVCDAIAVFKNGGQIFALPWSECGAGYGPWVMVFESSPVRIGALLAYEGG